MQAEQGNLVYPHPDMEFRAENFVQFIKKIKPPIYWWFLILGLSGMVFILYSQSFHDHPRQFWIGVSFITLGFCAMTFWIFGLPYTLYKSGKKALADLGDQDKEILYDVGVNVKGFDVFRQKNVFPPDMTRPIYDFDRADIILAGPSFILMGKSLQPGSLFFACAIELTQGDVKTRAAHAKIDSWTEGNGRIEIRIVDPNYKDKIGIEFKDEVKTIKRWLATHTT